MKRVSLLAEHAYRDEKGREGKGKSVSRSGVWDATRKGKGDEGVELTFDLLLGFSQHILSLLLVGSELFRDERIDERFSQES